MYLSAAGPNNPSFTGTHLPFVSAWEKNNGTTNFTLKVGDATTGGLTTTYSGALPNGYSPMKVQPSILLGTGGDNSDGDMGEFFEGAVTAGFPTDATENAVQASLATAGYGGNSTLFATSESVISLRAHANNKYVDAANNGANPLIADATTIGKNQTFDLFASPGGAISLRAHANGHIVTADNAGASPLIANRGAAGPWETFDLINNPDGSVSFRARANGKIVTAENAGSSALIANRTAIGPWEEFDLVRDTVPVSFRAHANSRLVTAENAGASRTHRQPHRGRRVGDVRPDRQQRRQRELPRAREQPDRHGRERRQLTADREPYRDRPVGVVRPVRERRRQRESPGAREQPGRDRRQRRRLPVDSQQHLRSARARSSTCSSTDPQSPARNRHRKGTAVPFRSRVYRSLKRRDVAQDGPRATRESWDDEVPDHIP